MSKNLGVVKKLTKWSAGCGLIELWNFSDFLFDIRMAFGDED